MAAILGFVTAITMVGPLLLDLSRELGVALGQAGLLAAAMSLPWALGAPFTGLLSDRLGRRPLIVLALAGIGLSTIAAAFATSFLMLLLARFAAGVFGAFGPASVMAAVGDLYPPPFLMLSYGLTAADVAPALALVAIGTIVGNTLGGWLGDRYHGPRAAIFVCAQLLAGSLGLALFGIAPGLVLSVVLGAAFGLVNATSRPAFLALGSELSPRYRGALLGLLSLTNQGGSVLGSSLGGLAIGLGSYGTLAILTLCGGLGAAALAVPLARLKLAREA